MSKSNLRYEKCKKFMSREGLDVVVALSPENVFYFGETYISTQKSIRDRLAMVVLPLKSDPAIIACIIEENTVAEETWIQDIRTYIEFKESPMKLLVDVLKEKGLDKKRVGIELDYLMAHYYKELVALLPDTELVLCTKIFDKVRMIKEKREIDILAYAASSTRKAFEAVGLPFHMVHTGHALGISVHEYPIMSPKENQVLLEDMVLCLEHSAHVDGYRYHVEDLIQITPSCPKVLTEKSLNPRLLELL